jgi:DNA phosphorothioation-dependent restriction protein DptG
VNKEHFDYADSVSQPLFFKNEIEAQGDEENQAKLGRQASKV